MIEVSVPASSANLGSGFDAVAVALDLRMTARARAGAGPLQVRVTGSQLPTHGGLAERVRAGMALIAEDPKSFAFEIDIHNDIPLGAGLGSSAAALLCGMTIANRARGSVVSKEEMLGLLVRAEGHADNAAAALYGGLCFVLQEGPHLCALPLPVPEALRCTLVVPDRPLDTAAARRALPASYARADVGRSLQRASMLAACLASGRLARLDLATRDCVHQPYRAALFPGLSEALDQSSAGVHVVLSGAGPSVLLLSEGGAGDAPDRVAACFRRAGVGARIVPTAIASQGLLVTEATA